MDKFPARMFRWAAIYGVIVLVPLYLTPLPPAGAEVFLGFVGLALVFQGLFWTIGSDPLKYRPLMPYAVAEKLVFGLPTLLLLARGYPVPLPVAVFAGIDLLRGRDSIWRGAGHRCCFHRIGLDRKTGKGGKWLPKK